MTGVMRKARAITAAAARDLSPHAQTKAVGGMATQAQQVAHELHPGEVAVAPGHLHDPADQEADEQRLEHRACGEEVDPLGWLAAARTSAQTASSSATTMIAVAYGPVTSPNPVIASGEPPTPVPDQRSTVGDLATSRLKVAARS